MSYEYGEWRADVRLLLRDHLASPDWVVTRGLFVVLLVACVYLFDGGMLFFAGQGAWWVSTKWFPGWVERQTRWDNVEDFFTEEETG